MNNPPLKELCIHIYTSVQTLYKLNDVFDNWSEFIYSTPIKIFFSEEEYQETFVLSKESQELQEKYHGLNFSFYNYNTLLQNENNNIDYFIEIVVSDNFLEYKRISQHSFSIGLSENLMLPQHQSFDIDVLLKPWDVADYVARFLIHWQVLQNKSSNEAVWHTTLAEILKTDIAQTKTLNLTNRIAFCIAKRITVLKKSSLKEYILLLKDNISEYQKLLHCFQKESNVYKNNSINISSTEKLYIDEDFLLKKSAHSLFLVNKDYTIFSFNETAERELYAIKNQTIKKGDSVLELITPTDREWFIRDFAKACNGQVVDSEKEVLDIQGNTHYFYYSYVPFKINANEIEGVCICVVNVTQQKLAVKKILSQEHTFSTILNNALTGLILYNHEDEIIEVNDAAIKLFGYAKNELIGKKRNLIIEYTTDFLRLLSERDKQGKVVGEAVGVKKDGTRFTIEFSSAVVDDLLTNTKYFCSAITDISKRKQQEQLVQETNNYLNHLIDNLKAGVVVHNADTSIRLCNKQSEIILGLTKDQMLGKVAIDPSWRFYTKMKYPCCSKIIL